VLNEIIDQINVIIDNVIEYTIKIISDNNKIEIKCVDDPIYIIV